MAEVLPRGMKKALQLYRNVPEELLQTPDVQDALGTIRKVMKGQIRRRHVHVQLQAAIAMLEIYVGKPNQRLEHDAGPTLAEMLRDAGNREPSASG